MAGKLNVSLTDFMYAVVVSAAFQRIDAPLITNPPYYISDQNLFLFLAFILVIDDWVLYHIQAANIQVQSNKLFAKSLAIDFLVLIFWYCAAISGSKGIAKDFYIFTALFYFATLTWEFAFVSKTKNNGRQVSDITCLLLFIFGCFFHTKDWFSIALAPLIAIWLISRGYAWKKIVLKTSS